MYKSICGAVENHIYWCLCSSVVVGGSVSVGGSVCVGPTLLVVVWVFEEPRVVEL